MDPIPKAMQKTGEFPPTKYQWVKKLNSDEIEWLASLPYIMTFEDLEMRANHNGLMNGPNLKHLTDDKGECIVACVLNSYHKGKPELAAVHKKGGGVDTKGDQVYISPVKIPDGDLGWGPAAQQLGAIPDRNSNTFGVHDRIRGSRWLGL